MMSNTPVCEDCGKPLHGDEVVRSLSIKRRLVCDVCNEVGDCRCMVCGGLPTTCRCFPDGQGHGLVTRTTLSRQWIECRCGFYCNSSFDMEAHLLLSGGK